MNGNILARVVESDDMPKVVDIRGLLPWHPKRRWAKRSRVDKIVLHTTASDNQDPFKTNAYHIRPGKQNHISRRGCPHIAYHDFITKNGTVYRCNSYDDWTWHAGIWNRHSIGIVMAFRGQDGNPPPEPQYKAAMERCTQLCLWFHILPKNVKGHREAPGIVIYLGHGRKKYRKTCPGMGVDLDEVRHEITLRLQRKLSAEGLYLGKVDGIFGPKSREALSRFRIR